MIYGTYIELLDSFFWEEHFRKSWHCARSWCLVQPSWLETQFHVGRCARFLCPPSMEQRMETSSARLEKDGKNMRTNLNKKTLKQFKTKTWICLHSVYVLFAPLIRWWWSNQLESQYNSWSHIGRTYEQLSAQMLGIENLMTQMVGQVGLEPCPKHVHSRHVEFQIARLDWAVFKENVHFQCEIIM